jgi:hypothetical protein
LQLHELLSKNSKYLNKYLHMKCMFVFSQVKTLILAENVSVRNTCAHLKDSTKVIK